MQARSRCHRGRATGGRIEGATADGARARARARSRAIASKIGARDRHRAEAMRMSLAAVGRVGLGWAAAQLGRSMRTTGRWPRRTQRWGFGRMEGAYGVSVQGEGTGEGMGEGTGDVDSQLTTQDSGLISDNL